jgi:uncharacterized protein YxjI
MSLALDRNVYFVKEHVGLFKAANEFDLFEPTGEHLLQCREPNLGPFAKILRFTDFKRMTPFDIRVKDSHGVEVLRVTRGVSFLLSKVSVHDGGGTLLGGFQQRFFSIGGKFDVLDAHDRPVCRLQGKWTGWEFEFKSEQKSFAKVTKKWAGIGRELFTSADNYVLQIDPSVPSGHPARALIVAAVLVIDMVLKE